MSSNFRFLEEYRVSLQFTKSEKSLSGFIRECEKQQMLVQLAKGTPVALPDEVSGFVIIHGRRIDFVGNAESIDDEGTLNIRLVGAFKVTVSEQMGRHEVNFRHIARINGVSAPAHVVDLSLEGVGLEIHCNLAPGAEIEMEFNTSMGILRVPFQVRHCESADGPGLYRVGCVVASRDQMLISRYQSYAQQFDPIFNSYQGKKAS